MMILFLVDLSLHAQSRPGLEMLYYPGGRSLWSSLSTKLSYETVKGNYFELRRNYEQDGTIACSGGSSFSGAGRQTAPFIRGEPGFLFSWSELGYRFADHLTVGVVMQQNCLYRGGNMWEPGGDAGEWGRNVWEPGGMVALSFGGWAFPLYLFKSGGEANSVAAGICYQ